MNVTETSAEGLKRQYKITVPASEVEAQITRRLGEIGRSVRIPGFRPGKVPLPLLRLGARYLLQARAPSGRARDPVAHFHLSNGARVEQLNWLGDVSEKGLQQSAGMMVNYLYRLGDIEANHEAYRDEGQVAASAAVRNLARS